MAPIKRFSTPKWFRRRLVLATLTGVPVKIENIRADDANPGLRDYEVSFLRLLEKLTNGSVIEISYTGTMVVYRPGLLYGGVLKHECPASRGIGYYLEALLLLAPFCKNKVSLTCTGVTTHIDDISVDGLRTSLMPMLAKFGIFLNLQLRVLKRAFTPSNDGEVLFSFPHQIRQPKTVHLLTTGKIKRIRGIASSTRLSAATVNRMIESARGVLNPFVPDVYLYSDVSRGSSPGFALSLVAESNSGGLYSAEIVGSANEVAEDVGQNCARALLEEIRIGGFASRISLEVILVMMIMGSEDLGQVRIGKDALDGRLVSLLQDLKEFFGAEIRMKEDQDDFVCTVVGTGFVNANKKVA